MLYTFVEMIEAIGAYLCSLPQKIYELYTMPKSFEGWVFLSIATVFLSSATVFWVSILIASFIQAVAPLLN